MSTIENTAIAERSGLPEGWKWSTLGDVSEKPQYGWTTKAKHDTGRLKLLRTTDITSGSVDWSSVPFCTEEPEDAEKYLVESGDILISRAGSVGVSFLINKPERAVFASYLVRFRPKEGIDTKYFYYYLKGPAYWNVIGAHKAGIAVPNVNASKLSRVPIPIAPFDQQKRIVAEIEKQFSRLDEAVAGLKRIKANLKRYKASVLKAAVEGKLTEEWRKAHPNVETGAELLKRILAERKKKWEEKSPGKKYKEPVTPDTSNLPELPEGWVWATTDQLASPEPNSITDGPFGSNLKTAHYTSAGPRVIRLQNIGDGIFVDESAHISEDHFSFLKKHQVLPGDLVIAALGELPPRACVIPLNVGSAIVKADCIRFHPHPVISNQYLNFALNSKPTRERTKGLIHGVGRPRLNLGEIKMITVPLPPQAEQASIVAEVERLLSVAEEIEDAVEINLKRAESLRQSILNAAFSGQLTLSSERALDSTCAGKGDWT